MAIYTRKSVTDAHDSEFNSLEAQREAVEAYVASQRGQGWVALPDRYDDHGFTGANTDRPAFQRLLGDVEAGRIDAIAVYKIDRLSRSMLDFSQLLDSFGRHSVSFVSVTESFDTSTPAGRMVINMLASFAQFERETIAERVRHKVHAERRRGMWTGGKPPLGYDLDGRNLVVNEAEAEQVREIFRLYLELNSLLAVVAELNARGWRMKSWTSKAGKRTEGGPFTKTNVHALLTNPLFVGHVQCGDEVVDGQHEAVVDQSTWDAVQGLLSQKASVRRGWMPPTRNGALLRGLLQCRCGDSMIHHSARRHGRVYGYYVCSRALKEGAKACPGSRAPMGELDAFVVERIRDIGRDPKVLKATLAAARADGKSVDQEALRRALEEFEPVWDQLVPKERGRVLGLLLEHVVFDAESGDIAITFRPQAAGGPEHLNGDGHGARVPAGEPLSQEN